MEARDGKALWCAVWRRGLRPVISLLRELCDRLHPMIKAPLPGAFFATRKLTKVTGNFVLHHPFADELNQHRNGRNHYGIRYKPVDREVGDRPKQ